MFAQVAGTTAQRLGERLLLAVRLKDGPALLDRHQPDDRREGVACHQHRRDRIGWELDLQATIPAEPRGVPEVELSNVAKDLVRRPARRGRRRCLAGRESQAVQLDQRGSRGLPNPERLVDGLRAWSQAISREAGAASSQQCLSQLAHLDFDCPARRCRETVAAQPVQACSDNLRSDLDERLEGRGLELAARQLRDEAEVRSTLALDEERTAALLCR